MIISSRRWCAGNSPENESARPARIRSQDPERLALAWGRRRRTGGHLIRREGSFLRCWRTSTSTGLTCSFIPRQDRQSGQRHQCPPAWVVELLQIRISPSGYASYQFLRPSSTLLPSEKAQSTTLSPSERYEPLQTSGQTRLGVSVRLFVEQIVSACGEVCGNAVCGKFARTV